MPHAEQGRVHVVGGGDSTTSLAFQNGLFWESVWNHPKNSQLRDKRENANILAGGDEIFIPDLEKGTIGAATEQRHRFRRKGIPEKLNVRFLDLDGEPYAGKPYRLIIDGGAILRGSLDGDGFLRVAIPPDARTGDLQVGESGELVRCTLNLGHLDPISEDSGVQQRLLNLGMYKGPIDGSPGEAFDRGVQRFRRAQGLPEGTQIDDQFRDKLREVHKA